MNEFRFEQLRKRGRLQLPRPVLYVGVAIVLLAFFSIKFFQRAGEGDGAPAEGSPAAIAFAPAPAEPAAETAPLPAPLAPDDGNGEGILSLDGEGERLLPPRRTGGELPVIPAALLDGKSLASPSVYVRVGKDGLVAGCKVVSSSGSDQVDRLVLDALRKYTFRPAMTAGRPVEFSSVVTVPLRGADDGPARSSGG